MFEHRIPTGLDGTCKVRQFEFSLDGSERKFTVDAIYIGLTLLLFGLTLLLVRVCERV